MPRNDRTNPWSSVVDHIMLVMKMKSSSPANRHVKRMYVHVQKKKKITKKINKKVAIYSRLSPATGESWLSMVIVKKNKKKHKKLCLSVDLLNEYMRFYRIIL